MASASQFGFDLSKYHISSSKVLNGEVLGKILEENGIASNIITAIEDKAQDIFSVRKIREGKDYHLVRNGECGELTAIVYEPGPLYYVVYDLRNECAVNLYENQYETCIETVSGTITSTLWDALAKQNVNPSIIDNMEDALASSVDFYHTQQGDEFKLIFEKKYVQGEEIGLGKLIGANYRNETGSHYSVFYENGEFKGYYDEEGRPARSAFLRAPVKHVRISSGFSMRRFHPIRRTTIPHLGTDYAAPYGTPIIAVADGIVEVASYTSNNGRFVKLRHDKSYETQYLHMQGFARGIKNGARVRQGETLGYVGSTGLATGPHVCFRFWKNGRQVNHLREVFKPAAVMPQSELSKFYLHRDIIKTTLDNIPLASDGKVTGA